MVVTAVAVANQHAYGVSLVDDISGGGLPALWKAWASVEAGPPRAYVPVTAAMRQAVYRVSPAARELEPYLESPTDPWKRHDCNSVQHICDESGKFFDWDLRSAAAASGRVHSEAQLQGLFAAAATQITGACRSGALRCDASPVLATGLPPLDRLPLGTVASETAAGLFDMAAGPLGYGSPGGTVPRPSLYRLWASVIPGMPPLDRVAAGTSPGWLDPLLRLVDWAFRLVNLALLAAVAAGLALALRRRGRLEGDAGLASVLFLVSAGLGMLVLALVNAVQRPTHVSPLYWSDFVACAQLSLLFGAFAVWPVLRPGRSSGSGQVRADTNAAGSSSPMRSVPTLVG